MNWYISLLNRAQAYEYTSYPYTYENLERAKIIKELRSSLRKLLDENEKQAAEIAELKEHLEKARKSTGKSAAKTKKGMYENER